MWRPLSSVAAPIAGVLEAGGAARRSIAVRGWCLLLLAACAGPASAVVAPGPPQHRSAASHAGGSKVTLVQGSAQGSAMSARVAEPMREAPPVAASVLAVAPAAQPAADYALFRRFPDLATRLPRLALTRLPTPVQRAEPIEPRGRVRIYIKRDDLSAELYGGGKPRKLELLLAEARERGAQRLITVGGVASHHALATALFARQQDLASTVYLLPQPPNDEVRRNLLGLHAAGADMRTAGSYAGAMAAAARQQARAPAEQAYVLDAGGTSPRSTIAFVSAGLELAEQVRSGALPAPDEVYVAMGTMGSAVGLALGLELAELPSKVVAVRVSNRGTSERKQAMALARATVEELRRLWPSFPELVLSPERFVIEGGYLGGGYGVPTRAGRQARERLDAALGLALEDSYTAKTAAALLAQAQRLAARSKPAVLLYWHSHDGRLPAVPDAAGAADLPPPFRAYFPRSTSAKRK